MRGGGGKRVAVFTFTEFNWEWAPAPGNAAELLRTPAAALWPASGAGILLHARNEVRALPHTIIAMPSRARCAVPAAPRVYAHARAARCAGTRRRCDGRARCADPPHRPSPPPCARVARSRFWAALLVCCERSDAGAHAAGRSRIGAG
eukprot:6281011-Prymnesium_polylepis.1